MSGQTISFSIGGEVSLSALKRSIEQFQKIIDGLGADVAPGSKLRWVVDDLRGGSMAVTVRGLSASESEARAEEAVADGWLKLGRQLADGKPLSFSKPVVEATEALQRSARGCAPAMIFGSNGDDIVISTDPSGSAPTSMISFGSVTGRVQTVSNRNSLRFTIYQDHTDLAVPCYLRQGQEEQVRGTWGRRACVSGTLSRDAVSGRPLALREITDIELFPDVPVRRFEDARATGVWSPGDPLPEELIRELRDAE